MMYLHCCNDIQQCLHTRWTVEMRKYEKTSPAAARKFTSSSFDLVFLVKLPTLSSNASDK